MIYEWIEGRKLVEENAKKNAETYGERIDTEYAAMFSNFGLSDKSRNLLSNHLASIEQGRAEAESYLVQLGVAKEMYDKTARQLLSPEQYKEYRATEEARPAQRELKSIGEFFSAEGIAASGADQQSRLYEALKASKSTPVADGPYGSGAHALVGKQPVFDATTEDLRRLRAEHSTLLSNLPTTPEWDTVRQGISQYYGAQILGKQKTLEFMSQESQVHPPIPGQP